MIGIFRSLKGHNYKLWAGAALVSNVGTWMQRTAQDWLVLTQLTDNNAMAVGIVMALQFGPLVLLLPFTGYAADTFDRRKFLFVTQGIMGFLALVLGILTITGMVQLWHVYVCAFLLGCAVAFDVPTRQTFVAELVGENDLANAVALNSTSFHVARMLGPAVAGVLIAAVGTGWVFLVNGASFGAVLCALGRIRIHELFRDKRAVRARKNLVEGFRYVWNRPDLKIMLLMFFLVGAFGLNFQLFISTMSVSVFHAAAGEYGMLTSTMAIGSVMGALFSAGQTRPQIPLLLTGAAMFGLGCGLSALMPNYLLFGLSLVLVGVFAQLFTTSTNSLVQLSTAPEMRGRVIAILFAVAMGGTLIGGPVVGWVADVLGPRWAMGVAASSGIAAALVGLIYIVKYRHFCVRFEARRIRVHMDGEDAPPASAK